MNYSQNRTVNIFNSRLCLGHLIIILLCWYFSYITLTIKDLRTLAVSKADIFKIYLLNKVNVFHKMILTFFHSSFNILAGIVCDTLLEFAVFRKFCRKYHNTFYYADKSWEEAYLISHMSVLSTRHTWPRWMRKINEWTIKPSGEEDYHLSYTCQPWSPCHWWSCQYKLPFATVVQFCAVFLKIIQLLSLILNFVVNFQFLAFFFLH